MKQRITLLAIILSLFLTAAVAEMENTLPQVGSTVNGFTVDAIEDFDLLGAKLVLMTHEKTGGPVVWIANDDTNRSFMIGFRTHYDTDTGVPHVFEHAALSGSNTYPDPSLFFNMISATAQTYMNATTYPYMTIYPTSSISTKQLLKTADVYLAGVFEPMVCTDPHAMQREAYRYEMADRDADLTLTGTVYSEMLGAYYAKESIYELFRAMYPGSYFATCTGGQPGLIEEMTWQDLIDYHNTYYQPSNALTVLYGDLDLGEFLSLLGGYYDRYEKVDVSAEDTGYQPFTGYSEVTKEIAASADATAKTTLYYMIPLRDITEKDTFLLSKLLPAALTNEGSAMFNIMMERFPSSSFSVSLLSGEGPEPMALFSLEDSGTTTPEDFTTAVKDGITAVLSEGIRYDVLTASLKAIKISLSTIRESSQLGVDTSTAVMQCYTLTSSVTDYPQKIGWLMNDSEAWLSSGTIETVLTNYLCEPVDSRVLILNDVPGLAEQLTQQAAQKLADKKAAMTEEEIDAVVASTAEYNAWTESLSEVSMIDEVAVVSVSELPEELRTTDTRVSVENGVRYITAELENLEPIFASLYLRADMVPVNNLQALSLAVNFLGQVGTTDHSYEELSTLITEYGIAFMLTTRTDGNDPQYFSPIIEVDINCLPEDLPAAVALVNEILTQTSYSESDLIRYYCNSNVYGYKQAMSTVKPHLMIAGIARAATRSADLYSYYVDQLPYYQYLATVSSMDDTAIAQEAQLWQQLLGTLVDRDGLTVSVVGEASGIALTQTELKSAISAWPYTHRTAVDYAAVMETLPGRIAVAIPGSAAYNIKLISMEATGYTYTEDMGLLSSLVYDQILIPVMRYSNGVYSPISSINKREAYIVAYRDPSLTKTYDEVIPTLSEQVRSMQLGDTQLNNLVVGSYTSLAKPVGPISSAESGISDLLNATSSQQEKLAAMLAYKSATVDGLVSYAGIYDALAEKGVEVSAAPASMLAENADRFDLVINWYVE